jgi:DNA ligase-1
MKAFAELYQLLDQTNKTNAKVELLVGYFNAASASDKLWVLALFSGRTIKRTIKTNQLRDYCCEYGSIEPWLFDECYQVVGDLAEVMASILPNSKGADQPPGLEECIERIRSMKGQSDDEKKKLLFDTWSQLHSFERFVFNKLISGGFRIGVSQKLVCKALSLHTGVDENVLAHRLMGNWSPDNTDFESLVLNASEKDNHSQPYPFCLAYPVESEVADLGIADDWQAEWKWDGIRGQLIVRGGEMYLWSRGEELVTDKFPELAILKDILPEGTVLDGELLPYKFNQPLAFRDLQLRLNRKTVSAKLQKEVPVIFMAYDLLESDSVDRRAESLASRRSRLEAIVKLADTTLLIISPLVNFCDWQDLTLQRESSRAKMSEGLMLKAKSSVYETGRKKGAWWKWKVNPFTIDAVLIYAQRGHGRRANMYTDYTFALWDDGVLVPFAKAYSGLTDEEIRKVDDFIKKNTKEKFGPVRSVNAELVFEIAFEAVNISTRHKSGVAVRFPRIQRWRNDKKPQDANSLQDLKALSAL